MKKRIMSLEQNLKLSCFEFGYLYASIKKDCWDKMPRTLWLKLHIAFASAYLNHYKFSKQAKRDIEKYKKELKELKKGGKNGKKSK